MDIEPMRELATEELTEVSGGGKNGAAVGAVAGGLIGAFAAVTSEGPLAAAAVAIAGVGGAPFLIVGAAALIGAAAGYYLIRE